MPYSSDSALPSGVKNALPKAARAVWRKAYNQASKKFSSEQKCARIAWGAVESLGWKKQGNVWVRKSEESNNFLLSAPIVKLEPDQQNAFGWAYIAVNKDGSVAYDKSGESIDVYELEKAVYGYTLESRNAGENHVRKDFGKLIESIVFTPEKVETMGLAKDAMPLGWWVGYHIDKSEDWEHVKDGTYSSFSIGGNAGRKVVLS